MYKLLLSWRYLRTRWIALASIISVTLGVGVMIVVNSVMSGFTTQMQSRIHSILSDVIVEARSLEGVRDADARMEQIRRIAGDQIEGMTPTVVVPAMLSFRWRGNWITRQVQLVGVDEASQASVSDFSTYLQHPAHRRSHGPDLFQLPEGGFDLRNHEGGDESPERTQMRSAGWEHRRDMARAEAYERAMFEQLNRNCAEARFRRPVPRASEN